MNPIAPDVPECLPCGACCFGLIVRVDPDDEERFTVDELRTMTKLDDTGVRQLLQAPDGRCLALDVSQGRFFCTIYERRPGVCVKFDRGSKGCGEARKARAPGTLPG